MKGWRSCDGAAKPEVYSGGARRAVLVRRRSAIAAHASVRKHFRAEERYIVCLHGWRTLAMASSLGLTDDVG